MAYASQIPSSLHELSQALEMEWCDLGDLAREVADFSDPQKQLFLMKGFDYHGDFDGGLEFADTFAGVMLQKTVSNLNLGLLRNGGKNLKMTFGIIGI